MKSITTFVILAFLLLPGCDAWKPEGRNSNEWYGWKGATTIDPAGDVAKLQGRWEMTPVEARRQSRDVCSLVFDPDTAITTLHADPPRRAEDNRWAYRYVLNSSVEPKVLRYTHRLDESGPVELSPGHGEFNLWYSLDGDVLTTWTVWEAAGERPRYTYQRVK